MLSGNAIGRSLSPMDRNEARRALNVLVDPDHDVQIKSMPHLISRVLPGTEIEKIIDAAESIAEDWLYLAVNPVKRGTIRVRTDDLAKLRWLMIDVDASRPDTNVMATDAEHELTRDVAYQIFEFLENHGWPYPVLLDSGNGFHLLYRIDLENTKPIRKMLGKVLRFLSDKFDREGVLVDRETNKATQFTKLPGTWVRKGTGTEERPYRQVRMLHVPETVEIVPLDFLQEFGGLIENETSREPRKPFQGPALNDGNGGRSYAMKALESECLRVLLARPGPNEGRNNALNRASYSMGQLVGAELIEEHVVFDRLYEHGLRAELEDREITATIRSGLEAGKKKPRVLPERNGGGNGKYSNNEQEKTNFKKDDTSKEKQKTKCRVLLDGAEIFCGDPEELIDVPWKMREGGYFFEIHSAAQLVRTEYPPLSWVVPDLMSEGLNIIAGKPKQGKSMMALNLALTVAGGGRALGNIAVVGGDVLYLSLEDRDRRVSFRIKKMCPSLSVQANRRLMVVTKWPRQNEGGLFLLDKVWWQQVERPTLVIIDTWGKFRPEIGKSNLYEADTRQMTEVKDWADARQCSVLIVHHTRKMEAKDPFDTISGSQGLGGVADGLLVLQRIRNNTEAKISITGRDGQEQELAVRFDPENLTWVSLGKAEDYVLGKLQTAIIAYLKSLGGESTFTADIAAHLDREPDQVRPILHKLFARRLIRREGKAWAYPGEGEHDEEAI